MQRWLERGFVFALPLIIFGIIAAVAGTTVALKKSGVNIGISQFFASCENPDPLTCDDGDCDDDGIPNPAVGGDDCDDSQCSVGGGCGASDQTEPTQEPTPTPNNDQCGPVDPTDAGCSDGDCDGDGVLNPAVGGDDCNDSDSCVGGGCGTKKTTESTQTPAATPTPTTQATTPTPNLQAPTPGPNPTTCGPVTPTDEMCSDGDCDGDGALNPAVGGNDCNDADSCVGGSATCGPATPTTQATPVTTPTPQATPTTMPTSTSTPTPTPTPTPTQQTATPAPMSIQAWTNGEIAQPSISMTSKTLTVTVGIPGVSDENVGCFAWLWPDTRDTSYAIKPIGGNSEWKVVLKPGFYNGRWVTSDFWENRICGKNVTFSHTYTTSGPYSVLIYVLTRYKGRENPYNRIGESGFSVEAK